MYFLRHLFRYLDSRLRCTKTWCDRCCSLEIFFSPDHLKELIFFKLRQHGVKNAPLKGSQKTKIRARKIQIFFLRKQSSLLMFPTRLSRPSFLPLSTVISPLFCTRATQKRRGSNPLSTVLTPPLAYPLVSNCMCSMRGWDPLSSFLPSVGGGDRFRKRRGGRGDRVS